jgi:hypothetical protein
MIVYDNVCTPCVRKQEWRDLRSFAREHKLELARVDIKKQPQHKEKALQYGIDLPFVVHGNVALSLSEPLEGLLI